MSHEIERFLFKNHYPRSLIGICLYKYKSFTEREN
jgi:hypothetical protein